MKCVFKVEKFELELVILKRMKTFTLTRSDHHLHWLEILDRTIINKSDFFCQNRDFRCVSNIFYRFSDFQRLKWHLYKPDVTGSNLLAFFGNDKPLLRFKTFNNLNFKDKKKKKQFQEINDKNRFSEYWTNVKFLWIAF